MLATPEPLVTLSMLTNSLPPSAPARSFANTSNDTVASSAICPPVSSLATGPSSLIVMSNVVSAEVSGSESDTRTPNDSPATVSFEPTKSVPVCVTLLLNV